MAEITAELSGQDIDQNRLKTLVTEDLTTENTLDWLRDKAQVELVPAGSLTEEAEPETTATEEASESPEVE